MDLHLAPFRFDVSPPKGHPLCGGWIKPVVGYDDPLEAIGFVLLGAGAPIVLCSVDWTGLLNDANKQWRTALAEAAHTTPERVAVQCVHQHNAPFACIESESYISQYKELPHIVELDFFRQCLDRGRRAVESGIKRAVPLTGVAFGQAAVEKVACNRRYIDETGKMRWRGSATKDPALRELPEGTIDPMLKTVAFYNGAEKLAACHYYATHPMSYYGDGRVSSDFVGLARKRRQHDEPKCTHIYFTGCSGDVAAGKYNDGSPEARVRLTGRIYDGIVGSEASLSPEPIESVAWKTHELLPPVRSTFNEETLKAAIANPDGAVSTRNRTSFMLTWLRRLARKEPIVLSGLHLNDAALLHLPAESFIEYQLEAQAYAPGRFVATAAYGDGGPWYIPTAQAYPLGGYEVSVAFCDPGVDDLLTAAVRDLLEG